MSMALALLFSSFSVTPLSRPSFSILSQVPPLAHIVSLPPPEARNSSSAPPAPQKKLSASAMGEKDGKESLEDQTREGTCKGACEFDASKGLSNHIIPHILNLYSCAKPDDFAIYAPNAIFEDPLMCANGIAQIKSAFYSLSKVFSESKIVEYSVEQHVISPGKQEILIDNKQHYKLLGKGIDMISLIKLYVEGGKVVRHEDWWDKKPLPNRDTIKVPLAGRMLEMARRGSMLATHAMMRFGKDPSV